jgi:ABC-type transport system substrate-binding protein
VGDTVDTAIMNTIAGNINNVSTTYNMGLTVSVETLPSGTMLTQAFSGQIYMYALGWFDDYPWVIDFLGPMYAPANTYPGPDGWNLAAMKSLYLDAVNASAAGDLARLNRDTDAMNTIANQAVMYLWTFYPEYFYTMTSNVAGFSWNPSYSSNGPFFIAYSPTSPTKNSSVSWETANTHQYIDPQVSYFSYDYGIMQQIYEPLLFYNGTCGTCVIPWLAQSYTSSPDLKSYQFTLRPGIKFADGENLDSTAVYFSLNRALIMDGSSPTGHGIQASWFLQQLLNTSLATYYGGHPTYDSSYVNSVLGENFVQITSPSSFTINVMNPNSAFLYLFANPLANPVAPNYVMQHDLALWNQSSTGYKLPYPSLSSAPDEMTMIKQYFADLVATCNSGITPSGCGTTYLDHAYAGSLAGTGPYTIQSVSQTTNNIVFKANPNYWGGPFSMMPQYQTATIKYVPDVATREIDLRSAAQSGQAFLLGPGDVPNDHLYDVADRTQWIINSKLQSTIPGVSLYGAYSGFATLFAPFDTNVTNPFTGKPYTFQPFADKRFRLAFADAVNMTQINRSVNNNLGQVAVNVVAPGLPPAGAYNPSNTPTYAYNLGAVQNLLLDAMQNPITTFNFANGTAVPTVTITPTAVTAVTPSSSLLIAAAAVVLVIIVAVAAFVLRGRKKSKT